MFSWPLPDGKAKNALTSLRLLLVYNYHIYDYIMTTEYYSAEKVTIQAFV